MSVPRFSLSAREPLTGEQTEGRSGEARGLRAGHRGAGRPAGMVRLRGHPGVPEPRGKEFTAIIDPIVKEFNCPVMFISSFC